MDHYAATQPLDLPPHPITVANKGLRSRFPTKNVGGDDCILGRGVDPKYILVGGFKYVCHFHPYLRKIPILTSIFFKWVGSTTN